MSQPVCIGEPVSWLRLERYHLGELPEGESRELSTHLERCEACRRSLEAIEGDDRALPPLPEIAPREPWIRRLLGPQLAPAFAAAAAVLLAVVLAPELERAVPPSRIALKGGDLAISLVRERGGAVVAEPQAFLPGDRFQVRLTCPGSAATRWDAVVFQGDEAFFPLGEPLPVPCGNRVMLPGAFRLDGDAPATVCLLVGDDLPDREILAREGAGALPEGAAVCAALARALGDGLR